jgi:hypothetical protein
MSFGSHRIENFGFNFFGQYRNQQPANWDKAGFSDYTKINRWQVAPEAFFWLNKFNLNLGVTYTNEDRIGGAMKDIKNQFDSIYTYK